MNARTVNIIAENNEFFIADLDNGGVRLGMFDVCMFDFPANHAEYPRVKSLTLANAETAFDEFYGRYVPTPTDGYRNA